MRLKEFLQEEIIKLPKSYSDDYLPEVFNNHMKEYLEVVKKLKKSDIIYEIDLNKIEGLSRFIFNALEYYYKGNPAIAYNEVKGLFDYLEDKEIKKVLINNIENRNFYRVRTDEIETDSRLEMFHLPFSKRYIAKPQRYSVLGLPYLYLGKSVQVCWEEMGKPNYQEMSLPNFRDMKISLFEQKEKISLLYLNSNIKKDSINLKLHFFLLLSKLYEISKNNRYIKNILKKRKLFDSLELFEELNLSDDLDSIKDDYYQMSKNLDRIIINSKTSIEEWYKYIKINLVFQIAKYEDVGYINERISYIETISSLLKTDILLFPLHLACSYIVKDKERIFKPEYIIPQLVSQYISEYNQTNKNKIDGISYMSTKIHDYSKIPEDYELYTNFALLTYPKQGVDYCEELSKKFRITERVSMKEFNSISFDNDLNRDDSIEDIANLYKHDGTSELYRKSDFFKMEEYLKYKMKYDID